MALARRSARIGEAGPLTRLSRWKIPGCDELEKESLMAHTLHSLDLKGKKIINLENGKVIATVNDVLFDPDNNVVAALLTAKAGLFNRVTEIVQRKDINLLGLDVVLANRADVLTDKNDVSGADQWL